jgi:diguanylate cyclase (GGDEF)-like protein
VGDQFLKELAVTLKSCVRVSNVIGKTTAPGDYLVRYGGEEFVVVLELTDAKRALDIAERIRQTVEKRTEWPAGVARFTVSAGVATFPYDGKSVDDLVNQADASLYYVKEELGRNKVCHCQQVPKTYKFKKKAAAIGGELGVFDSVGLLQSLSSSQKTGVLTVQTGMGRQLWVLFEVGKPVQARFGNLSGDAALVEFLVLVEDGSFNFQERIQTGPGGKAPRLEDRFNITRPIERLLLDGALAQDNFKLAKTVISSPDICLKPVMPEEFAQRMNGLLQLEDAPSKDERAAMEAIAKKANGQVPLSKIFVELEPMPTYLVWRAAALMVQHGLLETKILV